MMSYREEPVWRRVSMRFAPFSVLAGWALLILGLALSGLPWYACVLIGTGINFAARDW